METFKWFGLLLVGQLIFMWVLERWSDANRRQFLQEMREMNANHEKVMLGIYADNPPRPKEYQ